MPPLRRRPRPLPINELIAGGAILALAAWAALAWSDRGATPVALGPLDPSRHCGSATSQRRASLNAVQLRIAGSSNLCRRHTKAVRCRVAPLLHKR